jgi:SAM-dependent methyltransferase
LTKNYEQEVKIIEEYIKGIYVHEELLQILEAGCGQSWTPCLDDIKYVLTGVDLDRAALDIRINVINDLHEVVEGDLTTVILPDHKYDVIYNSYVLEHINGAEQVLKNFVRWIKPGGLIIILIPDPDSVAGFITRVTPHWFHVFYYRLLGSKTAGKPGFPPYPVHFDSVVSRKGIRDFCSGNNLVILAEYGDGYIRPGNGIIKYCIHLFKLLVGVISLGKFSSNHTNLLYILKQKSS